VHLRTTLPAETVVPIAWVAVGDPLQILPPHEHEKNWGAQRELDFPGYVFRLERPGPGGSLMPGIADRFGRSLGRHADDEIVQP